MRKFACTAYENRESGYTFVSLLLTLTIILVTMPIIVLLLRLLPFEPDKSQVDAQQFFYYLHQEALISKEAEVDEDINIIKLKTVSKEDELSYVTARYELYDHHIRRRVSGGLEVYLREVEKMIVTQVSYGFTVKLQMENGEVYEKVIEQNATKE